MEEDRNPHDVLEEQKKSLQEGQEITAEEELAERVLVLSESLIQAIEKCEDARQFAAVARLSLNVGQPDMALSLLNILIERLDGILGGYYDNINDKDLVEVVEEKMKDPKSSYDILIHPKNLERNS